MAGRTPAGGQFGWLVAAFLACLAVFAVNGGPLYYHDTIDYLNRGAQVLGAAGVKGETQIAEISSHAKPGEIGTANAAADDGAPAPGAAAGGGKTADVSRSVVYALIVGLFAAARTLEGVVVLNAVTAVLTVWLECRVVLRECGEGLAPAPLTFVAVIAGLAGSLGFYVAFLMPDIFTPALLVTGALLTGFAGRMTPVELLVAFLLGAVAVVVHNSHLVIAALLVPVTLIGALIVGGPRRWLAPVLMAAIALVGFGQLQALKLAVHKVEKADAVYLPFLTARLIQDGAGRAYLAQHCPDTRIAACDLWGALSHSSDPMRFTASHITFERSPRLGSYRLLPEDRQRAIANSQVGFFLAVLREHPFATASGVFANVGRQFVMNSIDMTLPDAEIRGRMIGQPGLLFSSFDGRFTREDSWIEAANHGQDLLYLVALGIVIVICAMPATPRRLRAFLLMVIAGIAINALVCGGISQPATRYGARVIWLLPAAAVIAGGALLRRPAAAGRHRPLTRSDAHAE